VLYDDLLPPASMLVEPLGQHRNRSGCLVGELEILRMRLKVIRKTCQARWYIDSAASFTTAI
jgi:hypothetical protein